uniref:Uncharacterized protein n=1 Tax=Rhizobium phage LG08 TaxID=3129229 RepID=A0AAU8HYT8_9CAUD
MSTSLELSFTNHFQGDVGVRSFDDFEDVTFEDDFISESETFLEFMITLVGGDRCTTSECIVEFVAICLCTFYCLDRAFEVFDSVGSDCTNTEFFPDRTSTECYMFYHDRLTVAKFVMSRRDDRVCRVGYDDLGFVLGHCLVSVEGCCVVDELFLQHLNLDVNRKMPNLKIILTSTVLAYPRPLD